MSNIEELAATKREALLEALEALKALLEALEALLEALEACENAMVSGDRVQPYAVYCTACCDCAEAIKKLIE